MHQTRSNGSHKTSIGCQHTAPTVQPALFCEVATSVAWPAMREPSEIQFSTSRWKLWWLLQRLGSEWDPQWLLPHQGWSRTWLVVPFHGVSLWYSCHIFVGLPELLDIAWFRDFLCNISQSPSFGEPIAIFHQPGRSQRWCLNCPPQNGEDKKSIRNPEPCRMRTFLLWRGSSSRTPLPSWKAGGLGRQHWWRDDHTDWTHWFSAGIPRCWYSKTVDHGHLQFPWCSYVQLL